MSTLESRVIAWLTSEGLHVGGARLARGTALCNFVRKECARTLRWAADEAHENMSTDTRDALDAEADRLEGHTPGVRVSEQSPEGPSA